MKKKKIEELPEDEENVVEADLLSLESEDYVSENGDESDEDEDEESELTKARADEGDECESDEDEEEESDDEDEDESDEDEEESDDEDEDEDEDESDEDEEESDDEDEDEDEESDDEEAEESVDYSGVKKLVDEEEGLTESFKAKAALIFKAEVNSQVEQVKEQLKEDYDLKLLAESEKAIDTLTEQVDSYLTYAVEHWMSDNSVAIESSLRTDLTENFISSLKNLFNESYIEVPESKIDLYANLERTNEKLEQELAKSSDIINKLDEQVKVLARHQIIEKATKGLAQTQASKLETLAENIEFTNEESFTEQVRTLREFYFDKASEESQSLAEEKIEKEEEKTSNYYVTKETIVEGLEDEEASMPKTMKTYLSAISKLSRASETSK